MADKVLDATMRYLSSISSCRSQEHLTYAVRSDSEVSYGRRPTWFGICKDIIDELGRLDGREYRQDYDFSDDIDPRNAIKEFRKSEFFKALDEEKKLVQFTARKHFNKNRIIQFIIPRAITPDYTYFAWREVRSNVLLDNWAPSHNAMNALICNPKQFLQTMERVVLERYQKRRSVALIGTMDDRGDVTLHLTYSKLSTAGDESITLELKGRAEDFRLFRELYGDMLSITIDNKSAYLSYINGYADVDKPERIYSCFTERY